jgi:hypothetical protein
MSIGDNQPFGIGDEATPFTDVAIGELNSDVDGRRLYFLERCGVNFIASCGIRLESPNEDYQYAQAKQSAACEWLGAMEL